MLGFIPAIVFVIGYFGGAYDTQEQTLVSQYRYDVAQEGAKCSADADVCFVQGELGW